MPTMYLADCASLKGIPGPCPHEPHSQFSREPAIKHVIRELMKFNHSHWYEAKTVSD